MSEPLMLETEEEVEVPAALHCALKVFLYGFSLSSHRCLNIGPETAVVVAGWVCPSELGLLCCLVFERGAGLGYSSLRFTPNLRGRGVHTGTGRQDKGALLKHLGALFETSACVVSSLF